MTKLTTEYYLNKALKSAKRKDGLIDADTLDIKPLVKILDNKLYDQGIDMDLLWQVFIYKILARSDYKNRDRALNDTEKAGIIEDVNKVLLGVPYKYKFYFKLPKNYPSEPSKLTKNVETVSIDQKFIDELEKINPISGLDKLLGKTTQADNSMLLETNEQYLLIRDSGFVVSGEKVFLESNYSPDRLAGLFYAVHLLYENLNTDNIARDITSPKAYDLKDKYRANFTNPIRSAKAAHLQFVCEDKHTAPINLVYSQLVQKNKHQLIESARVQLCSALYWYFEYVNAVESSLRVVFLVSVIDSLFPPRKGKRTPTVLQKAPLISEVTSNSVISKHETLKIIEDLFGQRNKVIHGTVEIHGYSRLDKKDKQLQDDLISKAEDIVEKYLRHRILEFSH